MVLLHNDPKCQRWSECLKVMVWPRDGNNGRRMISSAKSTTISPTQTLIGLTPPQASALMNCLVRDDHFCYSTYIDICFLSPFWIGNPDLYMCAYSFSSFGLFFYRFISHMVYFLDDHNVVSIGLPSSFVTRQGASQNMGGMGFDATHTSFLCICIS